MGRLKVVIETIVDEIERYNSCGRKAAEETLADILEDEEMIENIIRWSEDITSQY